MPIFGHTGLAGAACFGGEDIDASPRTEERAPGLDGCRSCRRHSQRMHIRYAKKFTCCPCSSWVGRDRRPGNSGSGSFDCHEDQDGPALLRAINGPIHRVRGRVEKIFGTCKRSYGLRRMRWRGLAKAGLQVRLTAMAYNLRRTMTILQERCA